MHWSPPGSPVHGILQARVLEWVAISFSRGSSWPRDQTHVSCFLYWQAGSLPLAPPGKPLGETFYARNHTLLISLQFLQGVGPEGMSWREQQQPPAENTRVWKTHLCLFLGSALCPPRLLSQMNRTSVWSVTVISTCSGLGTAFEFWLRQSLSAWPWGSHLHFSSLGSPRFELRGISTCWKQLLQIKWHNACRVLSKY